MKQLKILFATSEAHPLMKTGGLADVSHGLPLALKKLGSDIRVMLPAYPQAVERAGKTRLVAEIDLPNVPYNARILEGRFPKSTLDVYLLDIPEYFTRAGNPYVCTDGREWPDNAARFAALCRAVVAVAMDRAGLDWKADVVHCNDWQTGLVPALLALETARPATVFTVHNLAYQGNFPWHTFAGLGLPRQWWSPYALEFYGNLSFMKGGLVYADEITTVSPTYAREIRTPAFGYGLEGLLQHRAANLHGILNGADYDHWSPENDPFLPQRYTPDNLDAKRVNKVALQERLGLPVDAEAPLLGLVGRLVEQKGFQLLLAILPQLLRQNVQIVVLGSGDKALEEAFSHAAASHPEQIAAKIGYSEELAHLIEASADLFLMPSLFEPCGLNQIYSLRYGTIPIVHTTGGLADTVVDANEQTLRDATATGFQFQPAAPKPLLKAVERALYLYRENPAAWHQLMVTAMRQDFGWGGSAQTYLSVYQQAMESQEENPSANRL